MLWAALAKIPDPRPFVKIVEAYDILPKAAAPFAATVPWIEAAVGICLVLGFWTRSSALVALLLLSSFGIALGVNIYRGTDISCGCFGLEGGRDSLHLALAQDLLLLGGALILLCVRNVGPFAVDRYTAERTNPQK